jgi:enoyl-[acyl-carrier protein] reductase/trans-2-enoyl-CoA reductase (NAD+)
MIIKPRTRGFICTTAHPKGCAAQVERQVKYVQERPSIKGPRNVLVIGASAGYGLASRIVAAFGAGANTIGIYRQGERTAGRTASAGWYNSAAFEAAAQEAGLKSFSVTGDAFSDETKTRAIDLIRSELGQIDMVVYSVATARRTHPKTDVVSNSVLKPIGKSYTNKTVNFHTGEVSMVTLDPATEEEMKETVEVMGGEDWQMWMDALQEGGVLADGATTVAYSYIGSQITQAIYREGTIGLAKDHLEATAINLNKQLGASGGRAFVTVGKALVTQSSSAIPVVPLYISILYKVMKERGVHEGCIEQIYRLFTERLYGPDEVPVDEEGRIRMDDWELREDVQSEVTRTWEQLTTDRIDELSDLVGYRREFFQLFGFETDGVDYEEDIDPNVSVPNLY